MSGDGMGDGITSAEGRLLAVQMSALRDDLREVKETMRSMASSLEKMVRIEEQQKDMRSSINRAFDEIKIDRSRANEIEARVAAIERTMPGLRELRGWVIGGVLSGLAMMATALVTFFIQHHIV